MHKKLLERNFHKDNLIFLIELLELFRNKLPILKIDDKYIKEYNNPNKFLSKYFSITNDYVGNEYLTRAFRSPTLYWINKEIENKIQKIMKEEKDNE